MGGNPNDPLTKTNSNTELIMADVNDKAVPEVSVRTLSVARKHRRWVCPVNYPHHLPYGNDGPDVPAIRLMGQWLERAGFEMESQVRVEVQKGKLVITPA